jgi:hypothetical protein
MIAKFNNIKPENFERLARFVKGDLNFIQVTRRPEEGQEDEEDEDFDSGRNSVRVVKILNYGRDEKAAKAGRIALFVDIMMKDWLIDFIEVPNKGWRRLRLPIPRQFTDLVFDCLGVFPDDREVVKRGIDNLDVADELCRRFSAIQDRYDEEAEKTDVT